MILVRAIELAKKAHHGQERRFTGEAYIMHPARVAMQVSLLSYTTETMIAAAWLHDVLEDTKVTFGDMVMAVGGPVAGLVKELTFDETNLTKLDYEQRKQVQNAHVADASYEAKSIKILDRLDNLDDFARSVENGECKPEKLERYIKTSWELQKLLGALTSDKVDYDLVVKLRLTLLEMAKYFNMESVITA